MRHESNRDVAILMRLEAGVATPWSASGLAKGIKDVLERCAATMDIEDAKQLTKGKHALVQAHPRLARSERPPGRQRCADPGRAEQSRARLDRHDVGLSDDRARRAVGGHERLRRAKVGSPPGVTCRMAHSDGSSGCCTCCT